MAFRFQPSDETVESAVRRIACAELDAALAAIRAAERPPGRVVHEVRRRCKALRGLIRLVRPAFPSFAAENAALRDIARQLAGVRDGAVLADTLARLAGSDGAAIASLRTAIMLTRPRRARRWIVAWRLCWRHGCARRAGR